MPQLIDASKLTLTEERRAAEADIPEGYKLLKVTEHTPFLHYLGPLFYKRNEAGNLIVACRANLWNLNGMGVTHGGCLMALADFTMCSEAMDTPTAPVVSISFNCEFCNPAPKAKLIVVSAETTRKSRDLVFLRGEVRSGSRVALTYSGVAKKLPPKN